VLIQSSFAAINSKERKEMKPCSVNGCPNSTGRFGGMCARHRQRKRRHGHQLQTSIKASDIKTQVGRVEQLIERDRSGKITAGLEKVVEVIQEYAEGITSDYDHGRPMVKHSVQAAKEVLTVFREFSSAKCASVVAGMYLFLEAEPHRFVSDRGFTFELVRRFRSISDANIGLYEDNSSGRVRRAYKEISPRTIEQLGGMLIAGFNRFVGHVRLVERRRAEREREARVLLEEGFATVVEEEGEGYE
jgi:hypothetical protein